MAKRKGNKARQRPSLDSAAAVQQEVLPGLYPDYLSAISGELGTRYQFVG